MRFFRSLKFKILLLLFVLVVIPLLLIARVYYKEYSELITQKLQERREGIQSGIYAAPVALKPGKQFDVLTLVRRLDRIGYPRSEHMGENTDWGYRVTSMDSVEIQNPPTSSDSPSPNRIEVNIQRGKITSLVVKPGGMTISEFMLLPELVTNITGKAREKRRIIKYEELPRHLIYSVLASEDKRFFNHLGLDPFRIAKSLMIDAQAQEIVQGGSTLTQQFVKNFFLTQERTWKRKITEGVIALMLERRLSKTEIFELYINEVYLGQRGSFGIIGFGQAAEAYFNKQAKDLSLAECALLASSISAPNRYNAYRYPDLMLNRRNALLDVMEELGYIQTEQKVAAKKEPLGVKPSTQFNYSDAPYFVDFIEDQLEKVLPADAPKQYYKIFTTLDSDLQKAAYEAMRLGIVEIDERLLHGPDKIPIGTVQASLIAVDPHNGHILAYLGGRNYSASQFNRVTAAKRQPGSIFKPFVYAAALETAFTRPNQPLTIATTVVDKPDAFESELEYYAPKNYKEEYEGLVNLRKALSRSLNIATIKVAEKTGFQQVVDLAVRAGMNENIKPYPSMALGTFEVTLMEMAKAYTTFINSGTNIEPVPIREIQAPDGTVVYRAPRVVSQVLSPQTAYLVTNLLETNIDSGTGQGARARGFTLPAAGKTGTSFDGWFAGYTPDLLCIVWVGFDDNHPLGYSGAQSALPIWTEFMKKAAGLIPLRAKSFEAPEGIVEVEIDPITGMLATSRCLERRTELFIKGTEPTLPCTGNNYENLFRNAYPD
jgi:penicillin-binding protein 1B